MFEQQVAPNHLAYKPIGVLAVRLARIVLLVVHRPRH